MIEALPGVVLREVRGADLDVAKPYILSTWSKSYENTAQKLHQLNQRDFYRTHHREMTRLLHIATTVIACSAEDHDAYLGWACGTRGALHYVFVRGICRGTGVGRVLVQAVSGDAVSFHTFAPTSVELAGYAGRNGMRYQQHPIPELKAHQENRDKHGTAH